MTDRKLLEWIEGEPACDEHALLHIPLAGYPEYMVYGYISESGAVVDVFGDDMGYEADGVKRHMFVTEPE